VYYDGRDYTSMPPTITDKTENGVTGTPSGDVGFDTEYKAFTFDGSGDYISGTLSNPAGDWSYSTSVWFKTTDFSGGQQSIFHIGTQGTDGKAIELRIRDSATFFYIHWGRDIYYENLSLSENRWYHACMTYGGGGNQNGNMKLYLNGILLNYTEIYGSGNLDIDANAPFVLGSERSPIENEFTGSIANFRVFNRAITADEVWQLYAYQKEYFGHGNLGMTFKGGRLGIGTSEPRAALDVYGELYGPKTKPCFSIHTVDYWDADDHSWGTLSGTYWTTVYKTPIPCVRRGWLEYDTHNSISFEDVTRGSNNGTIVRFKAPRSGFYNFSFNIGFKTNSAGDYIGFMLNKNQDYSIDSAEAANDYFLGSIHDIITSRAYTISASVNIYLKEGEFVVPYSRSVGSIFVANGGGFNFSGFYIG